MPISYRYDVATKNLYITLDPNLIYNGVYNVDFNQGEGSNSIGAQPGLYLVPDELDPVTGEWLIPNVTAGVWNVKQWKGDAEGSHAVPIEWAYLLITIWEPDFTTVEFDGKTNTATVKVPVSAVGPNGARAILQTSDNFVMSSAPVLSTIQDGF